jgi:hypothetical protein
MWRRFPFITPFITLSLHPRPTLAAERKEGRKRNTLIMRGVVPVGENTQKRGEIHGKYN